MVRREWDGEGGTLQVCAVVLVCPDVDLITHTHPPYHASFDHLNPLKQASPNVTHIWLSNYYEDISGGEIFRL